VNFGRDEVEKQVPSEFFLSKKVVLSHDEFGFVPFFPRDSSPYQGDWSSPSFQSGHCKSANTFTSLLEYTNKNLARVRTSGLQTFFSRGWGPRLQLSDFGQKDTSHDDEGVLSSQKRSGTHVRSSQTYSTLITCVQYRHGGGEIANRLQSRAVHGERQPRIVVRNVRVSSKCEAPTSVVIGTCVVGKRNRLAARHFFGFFAECYIQYVESSAVHHVFFQ
jgi:hypothetical protein